MAVGSLVLGLCVLDPSAAQAQYRFGTQDDISRIQDVRLRGAENEELFLGYMVRTQWLFLGYSVEDRGYVLGIAGGGNRYYDLPKSEELSRFQRDGDLPDPLPPYRLSWFDYAMGYSLWWGLVLVVGLSLWGRARRKAKAAASTPTIDPPPPPPPPPVPAA